MSKNVAAHIAMKDIVEDLCNPNLSRKGDTWTCTGDYLYSKEQRRLNRELGLWGVNMGKHNMSRY